MLCCLQSCVLVSLRAVVMAVVVVRLVVLLMIATRLMVDMRCNARWSRPIDVLSSARTRGVRYANSASRSTIGNSRNAEALLNAVSNALRDKPVRSLSNRACVIYPC